MPILFFFHICSFKGFHVRNTHKIVKYILWNSEIELKILLIIWEIPSYGAKTYSASQTAMWLKYNFNLCLHFSKKPWKLYLNSKNSISFSTEFDHSKYFQITYTVMAFCSWNIRIEMAIMNENMTNLNNAYSTCLKSIGFAAGLWKCQKTTTKEFPITLYALVAYSWKHSRYVKKNQCTKKTVHSSYVTIVTPQFLSFIFFNRFLLKKVLLRLLLVVFYNHIFLFLLHQLLQSVFTYMSRNLV